MVRFDCTFNESDCRIPVVFTESTTVIPVQFGAIQTVERECEHYTGETTVTPDAHNNVVLETANKKLMDDVTVLKVPYFETSNPNGETIYIASEV